MPINVTQWAKATGAIQNANTILIVTHVRPDGDAIGTSLALANAFQSLGKSVIVANDDGVPEYLRFLPGADAVVDSLQHGKWDVMIAADAGDEDRSGMVGEYGRQHSKLVINLDHHITNTLFGDVHLVLSTTTSAAEVAYEWLRFAQVDIERAIAMPLLTGIVTDTLGFRTNNVMPKTLSVAQELMQAGASLSEIMERTLESKPYKEFLLWQRVLPTAQLHGQILAATIQQEDIEAAGLVEMTDAGLVGFLRTVNEAMISVIFKVESPELVKVSLRSKPGFDVADVAFKLGGGGHVQAAGANVHGSIDEVQNKVLSLLEKATAKGQLEIV